MAGLFIGRFQPFHLGHLDAVNQALKKTDMLYIAIGSTKNNYRPGNPFTVGERIEMIKTAMDEAKISPQKYLIVPVPNINNYELWPHHVEQYLPPFEKIFTSSDIVEMLFNNANKNRKKPYDIIKIQKRIDVCSTDVRNAILKNKKWERMVPNSTAKLLKTWKTQLRLKSIREA